MIGKEEKNICWFFFFQVQRKYFNNISVYSTLFFSIFSLIQSFSCQPLSIYFFSNLVFIFNFSFHSLSLSNPFHHNLSLFTFIFFPISFCNQLYSPSSFSIQSFSDRLLSIHSYFFIKLFIYFPFPSSNSIYPKPSLLISAFPNLFLCPNPFYLSTSPFNNLFLHQLHFLTISFCFFPTLFFLGSFTSSSPSLFLYLITILQRQ